MGIRGFIPLAMVLSLISGSVAYASGVEIDVTLSPAGSYKAKTSKIKGTAYKTPDGGVAAEGIAIDLRTLTTGIGLRDKHTKEHLMVSKFPEAKLIKATGKDGKGTATLEIKGVTVTVNGTYKIEGNELKAEFPITMSQVDIKDVRYMGVGVKDQVTVHLDLPLGEAPKRAAASTGARKK